MQMDFSEFPLIWLRPHEAGHVEGPEHVAETAQALETLLGGERPFVLMADRLPSLAEVTDTTPAERKAGALMFRQYRANFGRLCKGMIMVGAFEALPEPVKKISAAMAGMIGVPLLFVRSIDEARAAAFDRLRPS